MPKHRSKLRGDALRQAIAELYGQCLSDAEIARQVGCTNTTVAAWRKKQGLPRNEEPGWPKKEPQETSADSPALPEVYGQIEALLAVLPEGASRLVRRQAGYLVSNLLWEYLEERLELKEGQDGA